MGDVRFNFARFLNDSHAQHFLAKVSLVEGAVQDDFIEMLKLAEGEFFRKELKANRLVADFGAEPLQSQVENLEVVKGQAREFVDGKPGGLAGVTAGLHIVSGEIDEGIIGHGHNPFSRNAVDLD